MIIHYSAGTAQTQAEYIGITNGFYFPVGEGGVTVVTPSRIFTAREKALRFTAREKALRFIARKI